MTRDLPSDAVAFGLPLNELVAAKGRVTNLRGYDSFTTRTTVFVP